MKRILSLGLVLTLGVLGCNQSPKGGGATNSTPSHNPPPAEIRGAGASPGSETFRIQAPAIATTIKQGDRQTVKLTLSRGRDFKRAVAMKAEAPQGLKVTLDPPQVKASDSETVTATIEADKMAPVGDHTIKISGTPESGDATSVDFKVKIEKKAE